MAIDYTHLVNLIECRTEVKDCGDGDKCLGKESG